MVDRSVSISLEARVSGFVAGIATAQRSVAGFTASLEKSAAKRQALNDLGGAFGKLGLAAGAGIGVAVAAAANFDQAMSRVESVTGASAGSMDLLRAAAIKAGQDTVFSASEAANAIEAMAKAGVSTKDILAGGLTGALNLASAGSIDVAQAADIAATAMNQFGLKGDQVSHIADVLASAANKAQGEVTDMAEALKYVGPVASQMGVSLEQTVGTVAELASKGILGSQAGTSLRGMLTALTSPSKQAADQMKQLGINVYDAQGKFVGFDGIAGQLHKSLSGLSAADRDEALGRLFGNQQITAARILYAGGAGAVDKWTKGVNQSGAAATMAATNMNNLKGDLEQLRGSLETALIGTGESAQGPLRGVVQGLTSVVNAYSNLPGPAKNAAGGILAFTAAAGGGIWAVSRLLTGISNMKANLSTIGASFEGANKKMLALRGGAAVAGGAFLALGADIAKTHADLARASDVAGGALMGFAVTGGPWGAAIGAGLGLLDSFAQANSVAAAHVDDLTASLDQQTGALTDNTAQLVYNSLQSQGAYDAAAKLGIPLDTVTKAALGNKDALASLNSELTAMESASGDFPTKSVQSLMLLLKLIGGESGKVADSRQAWQQQQDALKGVGGAAKGASDALGGVGGSAKGAADGITGVGGAADDATPKLKTFKGALADITGFLDKRQAWRDYQQSIDDWKKSIKQTGPLSRQSLNDMDAMTRGILSVAQGMHKANRVDFLTSQIHMLEDMAKKSPAAATALGPIINHLYEAAAGAAHATGAQKKLIEQYHLTPQQAATVIKQIGMGKSQSDIRDLLKQYGLNPKQLQTAIKLLGDGDAINGLKRVSDSAHHLDSMIAKPDVKPQGIPQANNDINSVADAQHHLDSMIAKPTVTATDHASPILQHVGSEVTLLDGKTAHTYVVTTYSNNRGGVTSSAGGHSAPHIATGGYITGPGTPTSDSIPAWLSNGEYVMKAAAVDKYGVNMMHRINALGFAGGGQVGGSATHGDATASEVHKGREDAKKRHAEHMAALRKQLGATQKQLDAAKQFNQSVQQNFRVDPFQSNATLQGVMASLRSDTHRTRDFTAAARNAKRLGLNGGVFRALLASGDTAVLDDITTRSQVKALEAAWRRRNKVTADLTFGAGTSGKYAGDSLEHLGHVIDKLRHDLRHLRRDVRDGAENGTRKGTRDNRGHRNRSASRANLP